MKEVVELTVTSFRGSIGGEHYYGRLNVVEKGEIEVRPDGSRSFVYRSGFGVERHPHDGRDVKRRIGAKEAAYLNKKDGEGWLKPSFRLKSGDEVTRFNDIPSLIEAAKADFPTLFDDDDILVMDEEYWQSGVVRVLFGPTDIAEYLEAHPTYHEQRKFLMGRGYLLKDPAQGIEARSDETPQEARPEGQEPGPKDAPNPSDVSTPTTGG